MASSMKTMCLQSLNPEALIERTVRARRRFKALVKKVIINLQWLSVVEDDELSVNVRKNVQLIKGRKRKKSLLTVQEKGMLCKPAEWRSREETEYLYRIIGGWKCFRRYPENVKRKLVAVTYFVYFPAGRIIVRQDQQAHAMYHILSGEVSISITSIDPVTRDTVTTVVGKMIAGSLFGEVALLHDIPRTATVTTLTPCEFLYLKKDEFNVVLKASVAEQWQEIRNAMSRFTYFQSWNDVEIRECCIYSKIKSYSRSQTILGDGVGISTSCYFVLRGKCRVIEHLLVRCTYDEHGRKQYKLYEDPERSAIKVESDKTLLDEVKGSLMSATGTYERLDRIDKSSTVSAKCSVRSKKRDDESKSFKSAVLTKTNDKNASHRFQTFSTTKANTFKPRQSILAGKNIRDIVDDDSSNLNLSGDSSSLKLNVETHFMQVCILSETACFGIGENMKRRRLVAISDRVECLLIPRYWLLQRTKGNVWSRVEQYLNVQIPSTRQVFEEFVKQRQWIDHRKRMATDLFGKPPVNAYYNVPYSIRINEDLDFGEQYSYK